MQCDQCHSAEATVHLTQVVEQEVRKLHLCPACAKASGLNLDDPVSAADVLMAGGLPAGPAAGSARAGAPARTCAGCGTTQAQFKKTGRFGCAACYDTFRQELPRLLKSMHRHDRHIGKIPERESEFVRLSADQDRLARELKSAVAREDYLEAARVRDALRDIESNLALYSP